MLSRIPISQTTIKSLQLPSFDGFPYIITRIVPSFYHVILLPGELSSEDLRQLARRQVQANQLQTCLLLDTACCLFLYPNGKELVSEQIPCGGIVITGNLQLCRDFATSPELIRRKERLLAYIRQHRKENYLLGDLTKGGRPATPEESQRLTGIDEHGVPNGLARCLTCGNWSGVCLDPNPEFAGQVMTVSCLCENNNRCARCGSLLAERKLNANYYNQADGRIWHYPGFLALKHKCPTQSQAIG